MSQDFTIEQGQILARLSSLCGGRVYPPIPDDTLLKHEADDPSLPILPYIVLSFGTPYSTFRDRSIMGEEQQPMNLTGTVECWAATDGPAEKAAAAALILLRGWQPSPNASQLVLRGGGNFQNKDSAGRPSRFMQSVNFETVTNLSLDL